MKAPNKTTSQRLAKYQRYSVLPGPFLCLGEHSDTAYQ